MSFFFLFMNYGLLIIVMFDIFCKFNFPNVEHHFHVWICRAQKTIFFETEKLRVMFSTDFENFESFNFCHVSSLIAASELSTQSLAEGLVEWFKDFQMWKQWINKIRRIFRNDMRIIKTIYIFQFFENPSWWFFEHQKMMNNAFEHSKYYENSF